MQDADNNSINVVNTTNSNNTNPNVQRPPHRAWQFTRYGTSQGNAFHRAWHLTKRGTSQGIAPHTVWHLTRYGTSQSMVLHRAWHLTRYGISQGMTLHSLHAAVRLRPPVMRVPNVIILLAGMISTAVTSMLLSAT